LGYLYATGYNIVLPSRNDAAIAIAVGIMFFFADLLYIGAYTNGGSLLAITTLLVLFPAIAQAIKVVWIGGKVNYYHVLGYIFAALAVILISKGSALPARSG
jgi:hypothetical protein